MCASRDQSPRGVTLPGHTPQAALAIVDLATLVSPVLPSPPTTRHTALFGAILALEALAPALVSAGSAAALPLHVEHVDERLGEWCLQALRPIAWYKQLEQGTC